MPERYDDPRNRERDREHRRDHDNHSGYGSMYDRGYDYAGSEEDHGRGRVQQGGPGHHDADWGRDKQQRLFGGQQQHGGYGQEREWAPNHRDRPDQDRSPFAGAQGRRDDDRYGQSRYGGQEQRSQARPDVYGTQGGGRAEEGGYGRDQSGRYERQDFGARGETQPRDRYDPERRDGRDDGRGGGAQRFGQEVRSFFDRHRGEHAGEHRNRFFGGGRDDDTGWNDRMTDARDEGASPGHRREGLWGERAPRREGEADPYRRDRDDDRERSRFFDGRPRRD